MSSNEKSFLKSPTVLSWISSGVTGLALLAYALIAGAPSTAILIVLAALFLGSLGMLASTYREAILKGRAFAFGLQSAVISVLVICLVGLANFLAAKHPLKKDFTRNQLHTLSDQTIKLVKGLPNPVKLTYFSQMDTREKARPLLENLKALSPKVELEYVDPAKEFARTKQLGIKSDGTLHLAYLTKTQTVEDVNEEKFTNSMIKLLKEKSQTLCAITGHGEKGFNSKEADGYELVHQAMTAQSYDLKEIALAQEAKIPDSCTALLLVGPNRGFLPTEVAAISGYLANGGRALIAMGAPIGADDAAADIEKILEPWFVKLGRAVIVDPASRLAGVDASMPLIGIYSKDNPVTRDFQSIDHSFFPIARPLEILPGAQAGLNVQWLAKSTEMSWAESDLKSFASGAVSFSDGADKKGPHIVALAVQGKLKDSKASANTRLVVLGSSLMATNQLKRLGRNLDFFMNAASWLLDDENLISIRPKEEGPSKIELTAVQLNTVFVLTVLVLPLLISAAGVGIWAFRRRL